MDITSGVVSWPHACPAGLMKKLLTECESDVRNIKSLDTCYMKEKSWECLYACAGDLGIVHGFIDAIDALEVLRIRTFEEDVSGLWPVIFRHANSLQALTFRAHNDCYFDTMTPFNVRQVASKLPYLTHLGIDISLKEAEAALNEAASPRPLGKPCQESCVDELVRIGGLQSVELVVKLGNRASLFCGENGYSVWGTTTFPDVNYETCFQLAQGIFDRFLAHNEQSALERVGLRFLRMRYEDRGQYTVSQVTLRMFKKEAGFEKERDEGWQWDREYMGDQVWGAIRQADQELRGEMGQ